jgi:excisionase family DNA binding protein
VTLHEAIKCGHLEATRRLINQGANPNADEDGDSPLILAIHEDYPEIVELLLECGADPNIQGPFGRGGGAPLHAAVRRDSARYVKMLLARGADPDLEDTHGSTPIHLAETNGYKHLSRIMQAHLDRNLQKKAVEQMYTVGKVAELLSVDESFVMNLLKNGKLRQVNLDAEKIRIPESSLAHYLSALQS